jgi:tripartite-type tricarboxylate transporter receptor subunit TctC
MPELITLPIERKTQFKLDDFQLLGNLVSDPSAFSVAATSPIKSLSVWWRPRRRSPEI